MSDDPISIESCVAAAARASLDPDCRLPEAP
jgi:hypothetical protein